MLVCNIDAIVLKSKTYFYLHCMRVERVSNGAFELVQDLLRAFYVARLAGIVLQNRAIQ